MPRKSFDSEIRQAKDNILVLGSMVEDSVLEAVQALYARDLLASQTILQNDLQINAKRFEIEEQVMTLIATQQPMAHDLRLLASVLEVAVELERIGDYAKGIATLSLRIGDAPLVKPIIDLPFMARKATDMLHRALGAFDAEDAETARKLPAEDDEVDDLYLQFYRVMMTYIMADPSNIDQATYLLWIAHNLERTADRVTNICERTLFVVTGQIQETQGSAA